MPQNSYKINQLTTEQIDDNLIQLASLLHANVSDGASVSFILPFDLQQSTNYWQHKIQPLVAAQANILLVAKAGDKIIGCVQLECDMPPNQPHRADIGKLLVHPEFRRKGIARALMLAAEQIATRENRTLLTLDTASDGAKILYQQLGYIVVGDIPGFALNAESTHVESTTIMYKTL